jgi:hypothetical protein
VMRRCSGGEVLKRWCLDLGSTVCGWCCVSYQHIIFQEVKLYFFFRHKFFTLRFFNMYSKSRYQQHLYRVRLICKTVNTEQNCTW